MTFRRKSATDQVRKIKDIGDDPSSLIHESHDPVLALVEPTAPPAAPVVNQPPVAIKQSGLSNRKTKVTNLRWQENLDGIISETAEKVGLTRASFVQLAALGLAQQPDDVVSAACQLAREVEAGYDGGESPVRTFRHSPRFLIEILEPLAARSDDNKSIALKAAAVWIAAMDASQRNETLFSLRMTDAKNGYGLTENAKNK
jgi:hypothetical protein